MTSRAIMLLPLLVLPWACSGAVEEPQAGASAAAAVEDGGAFEEHVFERAIVFLTPRSDSVLLVPWLFSARTHAEGVRRESRGLLARGGTWEPFFADEWETPHTRLPWRLLPRGGMRLLVGNEEVLEQIVFDEGPRQLDVQLGEPLTEWGGPRGESFRLLDGTLVLSSTRVEGVVLDVMRAHPAREPSFGDWGLLVSGDSLQVVLHASEAQPSGAEGAFRVWARLDMHELHWPEVAVTWTETGEFERARREVPTAFSIVSDDRQLRVDLTVLAAQLQAGAGEDPRLPVDGLLEVGGTFRIGNSAYPVRGFLRHIQP